MTYTMQTDDSASSIVFLVEHFAAYGIEMTSSSLSNGTLTVTTDLPLTAEQVEHLNLTVA